jgi:hypothetical protein
MPTRQQIEDIYEARRIAVSRLVAKGRITSSDVAKLCRHGRYEIAADHWDLCDAGARSVLLDSHPHVASTARLAQLGEKRAAA